MVVPQTSGRFDQLMDCTSVSPLLCVFPHVGEGLDIL